MSKKSVGHLPTRHCTRCEQHAREVARLRGKLAQQQHMAQAQRDRDRATIRHLSRLAVRRNGEAALRRYFMYAAFDQLDTVLDDLQPRVQRLERQAEDWWL